MKDRFKFRIWSKSEKKMMLFNNPALIDGDVFQGGLLFKNYDHKITNCHEINPEDLVLMQCTGLKDKNGKLIFEGDVLKEIYETGEGDTDIDITQVVYRNDLAGFVMAHIGLDDDVLFSDADLSNIEIIGNVYENPELLEVQND